MGLKTGFLGMGWVHLTLSSPDTSMCPLQRMSPSSQGFLHLPSLLPSLPTSFTRTHWYSLSAAVQDTGGPMPAPASSTTRDRKKEGSLTSKDSVTAEFVPQRESVSLLDVLWWVGTDTACNNSRHLEEDRPSCLHQEDLLWSTGISKCDPHKDTKSTRAFTLLFTFGLLGILRPGCAEPE